MEKMERKGENNKLRTTLEETIKEWNSWFPFDYRWRKKYNVPFGSEKHLKTSFFFMLYDLEEEKLFNKLLEKISLEEENVLLENEGVEKRKEIIRMSEKDIDKEFEELDLSKF